MFFLRAPNSNISTKVSNFHINFGNFPKIRTDGWVKWFHIDSLILSYSTSFHEHEKNMSKSAQSVIFTFLKINLKFSTFCSNIPLFLGGKTSNFKTENLTEYLSQNIPERIFLEQTLYINEKKDVPNFLIVIIHISPNDTLNWKIT